MYVLPMFLLCQCELFLKQYLQFDLILSSSMSGTPSYPVAKFYKMYQHWGATSYNRKIDNTRSSIKIVLKLQVQV